MRKKNCWKFLISIFKLKNRFTIYLERFFGFVNMKNYKLL